MSDKIETVEVALKVPKRIVDLLKAVQEFTKGAVTLEDWLYNRLVYGFIYEMKGSDIGDTFDIKAEDLIEAYGLDKLLEEAEEDE